MPKNMVRQAQKHEAAILGLRYAMQGTETTPKPSLARSSHAMTNNPAFGCAKTRQIVFWFVCGFNRPARLPLIGPKNNSVCDKQQRHNPKHNASEGEKLQREFHSFPLFVGSVNFQAQPRKSTPNSFLNKT
jgi:hypothetical protein